MASIGFKCMVRPFSSSSAALQLVKPKVQVFGTEGRYASALYSAASKKKQLAQVEKDLNTLSNLMKTDKQLSDFLLNPLLNKDLKKTAIDSVIAKKKGSVLTANLLTLMAENRRLPLIDGVVNAFNIMMAAERGEIVCEVVTAKELDAVQRKELDMVLKGFLKEGEVIKLTMKVDSKIIGGMKVSIGDKYVDMSIASKIDKYTSIIQTAV